MTSSLSLILSAQSAWASSSTARVHNGYMPTWEANLYRPLSASARSGFTRGGGQELGKAGDPAPPKMAALRSSSALAVNFFDPLSPQGLVRVGGALGLPAAVTSIEFERKFPHGLSSQPPNLDVTLSLANGDLAGVESKFTEPYPRSAKPCAPLKEAYFTGNATRWEKIGLPRCQALACAIASREQFHQLDAAQLLKHLLGLGHHPNPSGRVRLVYLWYACNHPDSLSHADEVDRFAALVDDAVDFRAMTYQALFESVQDALDEGHREYLRARYFG